LGLLALLIKFIAKTMLDELAKSNFSPPLQGEGWGGDELRFRNDHINPTLTLRERGFWDFLRNRQFLDLL